MTWTTGGVAAGAATGRGGRRDAFSWPDAVGLRLELPALEAFGLRARARQNPAGALEVEIDGRFGNVFPHPPLSTGPCVAWPFGAVRETGAPHEVLFAAPDHPLVALFRDIDAADAAAESDGAFATTIVPLGESRSALVVHPAGFPFPDLESLVGAAIARARRRTANRPLLAHAADERDRFAVAEHELRRDLRRSAHDVIEAAGSLHQRAEAALALYALNDPGTADELVRGIATDAADAPEVAALLVGACAAWRGVAPDGGQIRAAALEWIRSAPVPADVWSAAALAFAPAAAEAMGATDAIGALRAMKPMQVSLALAQLAAVVGATPAGRVLRAMHAELGVAPDAVRGRVDIRPASVAERIDASQITVGDAVLSFHVETGERRATFTIEQTSGATPLTVVLEPRVPAGRLRSARVDDTVAELDAAREDSDLRVRVQLVVDRPRRLELDYER